MSHKQQTIQQPVKVAGVGLHTGALTTMTFVPAPPNHGYKFQRVDLPNQPIIDALADYVVDTSRGTTIEQHGAKVHTVEHTLAALVGLGIDNVLIQIDGAEPPIMDGSSIMFVEALESVGIQEQEALRVYYEVKESITFSDASKGVEVSAFPLGEYRVSVMVDYNSPIINSQNATLTNIADFRNEIANCRTFVFLHELEALFKANLIKGGDVNNAVVIVDKVVSDEELDRLAKLMGKPKITIDKEGTLSNITLRFKNEPARHKLLDVIGDLALVGKPLKAQILAIRPGHTANTGLAKKIRQAMLAENKKRIPEYHPNMPILMDVKHIANILPHRYPFALLDKIYHLDDTSVAGIKNVTINEPFFMGHFPNNPVMPGVLQIEAMAQTGGILVLSTVPDPENYWAYLLSIDECRFKKMVLPGDTITFQCELLYPIRRGIAKMKGEAYVRGGLVCEAVLSASIVRKS